MNKKFSSVGMSLDGFIAGPNGGPENPLGDNGTKIHQWIYRQNNFPESLFQTPVYVLTNEKREDWVQKGSTVFHFISEGIESAFMEAKKAAGDKDIRISGDASTIRQFLNAGLADEEIIHVSPVLPGNGVRLFENLDTEKFLVDIIKAQNSRQVRTHHIAR